MGVPKMKPHVTEGRECSEHPGETITLYCQSDRGFGCVLCITESHRNCTDVTSIAKLSKDFIISKELKDLKVSAEKQNAELVSCKQILDEYHVLNDKWYEQSVNEFETFRAKVETLLDAMGKEVYSQAGELKVRNNNMMKSLQKLLESTEQELESLTHRIEVRETSKQTEQLFIEVKRGTKHIEENVKKLQQIKDDMHIRRFKFKANRNMQQMLDEMTNMVSSPLKEMSVDLECTAESNIKSPDDTWPCCISGIAEISPDEMMVVDCANTCLKFIHVDSKTIVKRRPLVSPPDDLTFIPDTAEVAVTLHETHEIQYFSADKQIDPRGSISVDGKCFAVQYSKGTLVVSFYDPGKVQIIDLKGSILKSFTTDTAGNQMFKNPSYLCGSPDHANIYVSDDEKTLTCLSVTTGKVSWKCTKNSARKLKQEDNNGSDYPDDEDENQTGRKNENQSADDSEEISGDEDAKGGTCLYPNGIVSGDDGCLCVCSDKTDCIHVVSPAGIRLKVIPMAQYKLFWPTVVCYSKSRDALYVSSWSDEPEHCNFIRQLSFTSCT